MIKIMAAGILALAIAACNNETTTEKSSDTDTSGANKRKDMSGLSEQERSDGWQSLYDGESTKGWHKYGGGAAAGSWKSSDGTLWLDTTIKDDRGDIVTDEEFGNFHLKLEWKISKNGNSGIIYYVHEDTTKYKESYETGPEMQVLDNDGHPDGKITKHRAGDLYDLISCSKETLKPVGEWNLAEIKCVNGKLDFYLNGENVVSTTMWDANWNKLVAGSKFKQWPGFGTFKSGKICLQDHGNMVSYRNIRIKKL
jgi:hypothetical protein